jgi:two-component SAPR family response regulator
MRDFGGSKAQQLFDILMQAGGAPVASAELVRELWGDIEPRHPDATLKSYVAVLRNRLSPSVVVGAADAYCLDLTQMEPVLT